MRVMGNLIKDLSGLDVSLLKLHFFFPRKKHLILVMRSEHFLLRKLFPLTVRKLCLYMQTHSSSKKHDFHVFCSRALRCVTVVFCVFVCVYMYETMHSQAPSSTLVRCVHIYQPLYFGKKS